MTVKRASTIIGSEIDVNRLATRRYCLTARISDSGYDDVTLFADNLDVKRAAQQIVDDAYAIRSNRVFERDGWKCRVSGCGSRAHLQCHHRQYRSHGRVDSMENLISVCHVCHERAHRGLELVFDQERRVD